ncbi:hypothetical protein D9M71_365480 [compost metagenome]
MTGHAQGSGVTAVAAGERFQIRLRLGRFRDRARRAADVDRALWRAQGFIEELTLGGLQAAGSTLMQTRQQLQAVDAEKLLAATTDQGRALGVEQLTSLGADREDLPAKAHRQQALPRGFEVLATAVEGEDDFVRVTGVEHPAFDLADGHGQQRRAVMGTAERAFAGQVENAEDVALWAMDWHRSAGKITEAIQVMLAAIDQGRPCFHQCRAEGVGAADRFAPAGAEGDVLQAAALETVGAAFDGEDGGVGVGEDDQPFLALTLGQVIDGR